MQPLFSRMHFENTEAVDKLHDDLHASVTATLQRRVDELECMCSARGSVFAHDPSDTGPASSHWVLVILIQRPVFLKVSRRHCGKCKVRWLIPAFHVRILRQRAHIIVLT